MIHLDCHYFRQATVRLIQVATHDLTSCISFPSLIKSTTTASHNMSQNGKLKFFAPSSYDDEPLEPPPAYAATPHQALSPLPTASGAPQTKIEQALLTFQLQLQEAIAQNHQSQLEDGTEEDREVQRQLLHLMGEFLCKVSKDSPKSIQDLPASVHGILRADLCVAPQEAVPLSSGWHLSGVSQRDDELIGRAVQEGRVWPTETHASKQKKEPGADGAESQYRRDLAKGLWSSIDALSLDEDVCDPRGTLWWNDERKAQDIARTLNLQLLPRSSTLNGADILNMDRNSYVQIEVRAEDMTFRRENEMGLWESKSGWTVVMAVLLLY